MDLLGRLVRNRVLISTGESAQITELVTEQLLNASVILAGLARSATSIVDAIVIMESATPPFVIRRLETPLLLVMNVSVMAISRDSASTARMELKEATAKAPV